MRHLLMLSLLAAACGGPGRPAETADLDTTTDPDSTGALAVMRDTAGREIGTLAITQSDSGIRVVGRIDGLAQGEHGIHIHTVGRCSPDFEAAGPHWNPTGRAHGFENADGPHLGDLENLQIQSDGSGQINASTRGGRLWGTDGVMDGDGAAVVVHLTRDDQRTDPDGGSGARIACGVIR